MPGKLLVTGASGTLGGPLTVQAVAQGWEVLGTYLTQPGRVRAGRAVRLDLRDGAATRELVESFGPDVIIHTAVTERSGPGYDAAIRQAGQLIAQAAVADGARLIVLSTDLVFDGSEDIYTEASLPRPSSVYGRAKADYERAVLARSPSALVVRTSLIYDFEPGNAQVAWMLRALECGETLCLYTDQLRCPIWAVNLADALLELAGTDTPGILHLVGPELLSRYDLGRGLLAALGHDLDAHIIPATAPEDRPKCLHLSVARVQAILQTPLLTLAEARAQARGHSDH